MARTTMPPRPGFAATTRAGRSTTRARSATTGRATRRSATSPARCIRRSRPSSRHARSGLQRHPLIMCEFSHAMGNSNGTLAEYWDAIESTPGLQGGFIWEWWDHGLVQRLPDGTQRWAYGGDFGETPHDGNFVADGMNWPDRRPKPAMWEHKRLAAPVGAVRRSRRAAGGRRAAHEPPGLHRSRLAARQLRARGRRRADRRRRRRPADARARGTSPDQPPGLGDPTDRWRRRGVADRSPSDGRRTGLGASATSRSVRSSCRSGPGVARRPPRAGADGGIAARRRRACSATRCLAAPPTLSLWRAPTDNDRIGGMAARWQAWGLEHLERRLLSIGRDGAATVVRSEFRTGAGIGIEHEARYSRLETGGWRIEEAAVIPVELDDLPRVGTVIEVVAGLEDVEWFGSGPHETYPDRRRGGLIGRWRLDGRRPVRPVHPAAGERRSRRRPLAAPVGRRRAGPADRARSTEPGLGDAFPRVGPRRRDARRGAPAPARDDRPPRRGPPRARDRELRPGHPAGVPRRARDVSLDLEPHRLRSA